MVYKARKVYKAYQASQVHQVKSAKKVQKETKVYLVLQALWVKRAPPVKMAFKDGLLSIRNHNAIL
jgi:hypothetical protein